MWKAPKSSRTSLDRILSQVPDSEQATNLRLIPEPCAKVAFYPVETPKKLFVISTIFSLANSPAVLHCIAPRRFSARLAQW